MGRTIITTTIAESGQLFSNCATELQTQFMLQRMVNCADNAAACIGRLLQEQASRQCAWLAQRRSMLGAISPGLYACD